MSVSAAGESVQYTTDWQFPSVVHLLDSSNTHFYPFVCVRARARVRVYVCLKFRLLTPSSLNMNRDTRRPQFDADNNPDFYKGLALQDFMPSLIKSESTSCIVP